jgi:hypothetical protein
MLLISTRANTGGAEPVAPRANIAEPTTGPRVNVETNAPRPNIEPTAPRANVKAPRVKRTRNHPCLQANSKIH